MKPQIEEKIELTVPGPVPKEPDYYVNTCDCEQCLIYQGTYEKDEDAEVPNTPDYIQEHKNNIKRNMK